jgi:hypothetical protein
MTAPRTSNVSPATPTIPPAIPIVRDAGAPLLKKVRAIRPMLAERNSRKRAAAIPAI